MHGFTQGSMVLHKGAWFYTLQCTVYTLMHGFTQVCMALYTTVHGLHMTHGFTQGSMVLYTLRMRFHMK